MKAVVAFGDLQRAVAEMASVVKGARVPVLGCVRLQVAGDVVTAEATDFDLWLKVELAGGFVDGEVVVNARRLAGVLKVLKPSGGVKAVGAARVQLVAVGNTLTVSVNGGPDVTVPIDMSVVDFPKFPAHDTRQVTALTGADVDAIVHRVLPAAGTDQTIPVLCNVHLSRRAGETFADATDRYRAYRLAIHHAGDDFRLNIPTRGLAVAVKVLHGYTGAVLVTSSQMGEEEAEPTGHRALVTADGAVRIVWAAAEVDFPRIGALIPTDGGYATVDRRPLVEALNMAAGLLSKGTPVRLGVADDGVTVTAHDSDGTRFSTTIAADMGGLAVVGHTDGFNPAILAGTLAASPTDVVVWRQPSPLKPAVFASGDWQGLVMPMRIGDGE